MCFMADTFRTRLKNLRDLIQEDGQEHGPTLRRWLVFSLFAVFGMMNHR